MAAATLSESSGGKPESLGCGLELLSAGEQRHGRSHREMPLKKWSTLFLLLSSALSVQLAGQSNYGWGGTKTPGLSSLSPTTATAGSASFTLTVTGTNLCKACVVLWNGSPRPTTNVSSTSATAVISGTDLTTAATYSIVILNTLNGTQSNSLPFTVSVGIAISPSATLLLGGNSQQFSASVSGTTNTAVTWAASGGTVSSSGMYTAPSSPGSYVVTATSMADNTKKASASVAVSVPVAVTVSPTSASLQIGGTQQFSATVTGGTNTAVNWSVTGGTISSTGLYTAPTTAGTYTVTATSAADTTKSASATVTVAAPVVISVSPTTASIQTGGTQQFTATVTGTSNTAVTWSATAGSISSAGFYTAPSTAGSYTVTAISAADTSKSASATVNVTAPVVSLSVTPTSATLTTGRTQQFTATVSGTSNTGVTWTATGGSVSTAGLYTAPTTAGSYTVTATSVADNTKSASAIVSVSAPVAVSVTPSSASLLTAGSQQFTATVSGSTNTSVTWSTNGGTVSSSGLYTAPSSGGNYTVTATSVADSTKSASATVTVSATVAVSISPTSASLLTGGTQQFTATVSGTTNTSVNWSASGGTISYLGYYSAPSTAGTYTVTATSAADSTKSASATVTVSAPIQHTVNLSWTDSSTGIAGYRVYRGGQPGGPYTLLNSTLLSTISYSDSTVQSGQAYYYVTTAVSTTGMESAYSNQVEAVVPSP